MKRIMEKLETLLEWGGLKKRNYPAGDFRNFLAAEPVSHSTAIFDCMGCNYFVWCADYFRSYHRAGYSV